MVYSSNYDSPEVAIEEMMRVEASKRMIAANSQGEDLEGGMKPPIKRNLELQINLQNVPIDQTRYDDLSKAKRVKE